MTTAELVALIASGREHDFYAGGEWKRLAAEVRALDRNECQLCRRRGRYRRGEIVHHVKHLKERPDLAMCLYDADTGERQLLTVCKQCHEELHPEALAVPMTRKKCEVTSECWE